MDFQRCRTSPEIINTYLFVQWKRAWRTIYPQFISSINPYILRGRICSPSSGGMLYIPDCWPSRQQSTKKHNTYQLYIYSIPPGGELQICPKHVEVDWRNNLRIKSATSWFLLHRRIEMHGQQNIKHIFSSQISHMFRPNMGHHQADHEKEKRNIHTVVQRLRS
jgi:hypothetical protein